MKYILETSNLNKQKEYQRFGLDLAIQKGPDRDEVLGTPEEVILYKTLDAGPGIIVEDTSLDIEGYPEAGINIRWMLESGMVPHNVKASWHIWIGRHNGDTIDLSHAVLHGHLTYCNEAGFGFDPYFIPDGHTCTLHQMSAEAKDAISPRRTAVLQLLHSKVTASYNVQGIQPWHGAYQ